MSLADVRDRSGLHVHRRCARRAGNLVSLRDQIDDRSGGKKFDDSRCVIAQRSTSRGEQLRIGKIFSQNQIADAQLIVDSPGETGTENDSRPGFVQKNFQPGFLSISFTRRMPLGLRRFTQ